MPSEVEAVQKLWVLVQPILMLLKIVINFLVDGVLDLEMTGTTGDPFLVPRPSH